MKLRKQINKKIMQKKIAIKKLRAKSNIKNK
jgi:hypothetical protein